jgi:hypothetical protein
VNDEQLSAAARTVAQLGDYLEDLKRQAVAVFDPAAVAARGYIKPSTEVAVRQLQLSYWKARNALFELVNDIWRDIQRLDRATPQQFLVALAAASLLVDGARFLREQFHRVVVLRRKLDEPDVVYGIPPRMYDEVQKSLTSPYHAWHLWQATRYYDRHREELHQATAAQGLDPLVAIIDRLRDRLRPPLRVYVRARLRVRGRRAVRRIGRDVLGRGVYALQEALGRGMANVFVRPGHTPSLPREIRAQSFNYCSRAMCSWSARNLPPRITSCPDIGRTWRFSSAHRTICWHADWQTMSMSPVDSRVCMRRRHGRRCSR